MAKHIVEISDEAGRSFKIAVSIVWTGNSTGSWRTLDKGFLRYNSGRAEWQNITAAPGGWRTELGRHLLLFTSQGSTWGMRLNDYINIWEPNDQGTGYVIQPWVLSLEPYRISWVLAD
ncbi:MAG TPA: hypothetical protein VGB17_19910 [Pyrinomonadaceae bacterium]|jgi:hypothetical protein